MIRATYVIALLLVVLGVVSLWRYVGYEGLVSDRQWVVAKIRNGIVRVGYAHLADREYTQKVTYHSLGPLGGIGFASGTWIGNWLYVGLTLPLWTIVALLFAPPAVGYVRGPIRRRRRRRRNQCLNCGYAREGNTSGVCPECGNSLTCYTCGYDLTGNISGVCPECGTA